MTNKYPSAATPYRYVRKQPNTSCYTRLGIAKHRYITKELASEKLMKSQEVYRCGDHFHIRTKR